MTRALPGLLVAAVLLYAADAAADADSPYLATIAVERAPGASQPLGDPVVSTLHVADAALSAAAIMPVDGLEILSRDNGKLRIRFAARPTVAGGDPDRYLESTWVVDFDEPAVRELVHSLDPDGDAAPTIGQLERFVFEHIGDKTYSRSFDLASQVALSGKGDCTEHAVLLAALARAYDYPARVVFGNLLIETPSALRAFGHAWTEVHDGERWQIRDATLPDGPPAASGLRYIPLGVLRDEGPGYALSMFEVINAMPSRISGVGETP